MTTAGERPNDCRKTRLNHAQSKWKSPRTKSMLTSSAYYLCPTTVQMMRTLVVFLVLTVWSSSSSRTTNQMSDAFVLRAPLTQRLAVSNKMNRPNRCCRPFVAQFQPRQRMDRFITVIRPAETHTQEEKEQKQQQERDDATTLTEVERLRREAEKMRLQADQMDLSLTLDKIQGLEAKLNNRAWLDRHPDQESLLREQLQRINDKFGQRQQQQQGAATPVTQSQGSPPTSKARTTTTATTKAPSVTSNGVVNDSTSPTPSPFSKFSTTKANRNIENKANLSLSISSLNGDKPKTKSTKSVIPPLTGFDAEDLELYIPVANDINRMAKNENNITLTPLRLEERMDLFRTAPELQEHFQAKIRRMLAEPIEEMQELETLKQEYFDSNSGKERKSLKRRIDQLETSLEDGGPVGYNQGIYLPEDILPRLSPEDLEARVKTIQSLPDILIATYMQRTGVAYTDVYQSTDVENVGKKDEKEGVQNGENKQLVQAVEDVEKIKLSILLDYYEIQLQLLEQARTLSPFTDELKEEFKVAYDSLPDAVQRRFASNLGMPTDDGELSSIPTAQAVLTQLLERQNAFSPLLQAVEASNAMSDPPEYNDIEFVDRSRYLEEFFPSIERLEDNHPSKEDADAFASEILGRGNLFMVTSKPERVIGGYYVRGQNLLLDDDAEGGSGKSAADKLIEEVTRRLEADTDGTNLKDRIDYFYVLDPSPPTDEELEMGPELNPIFVITTKDAKRLYQPASLLAKVLVSLSGLSTALVFSVGTCVLNDRIAQSVEASSSTGSLDTTWFFNMCLPLYVSLGGILLVHEAAHRLVASYYKFDIGFPTIIPSLSTGITGSITPLKSPPPNSSALFDFAIAGPLASLALSIVLLYSGLQLTQEMSLNSPLPVLSIDFIRSSSLGGSMVQFFLGKVALLPDQGPGALVELHPFAIAGFVGCLVNAMAMLPLGHTDGGRVSLAMFGRRGAFVTKLFTAILLVSAGLFGLDDLNILISYTLFSLIWQRELETPIRNEVDELDFTRGLVGILSGIIVGLILTPMF